MKANYVKKIKNSIISLSVSMMLLLVLTNLTSNRIAYIPLVLVMFFYLARFVINFLLMVGSQGNTKNL